MKENPGTPLSAAALKHFAFGDQRVGAGPGPAGRRWCVGRAADGGSCANGMGKNMGRIGRIGLIGRMGESASREWRAERQFVSAVHKVHKVHSPATGKPECEVWEVWEVKNAVQDRCPK